MTSASDDGLARAAKPPLSLVLMLGALTALGPLAVDMYLPALPSIARGLDASDAASQRTVAFFLVGLAVGQLVYGPLSDRYGRRPLMLFGLVLYVIGTIGCMVSPSIEALIGFRVVQALGACSGMVLGRTVVRDRFPPNEVLHVLSLLMLVLGLAPIFAPVIGSWILLVGDWRLIFAFQAVVGVAVGVAVLIALPESRSAETEAQARSESPLRSYASLLSERRMVGYMLGGAFAGAALFTYIASGPDVVIVQHHVAPHWFGWIFGVNGVGIIAATQVNARLARRWTSDLILRRALAVGLGFSLLMLAAAVTGIGGLWGILIPLFLVITTYGFTQTNALTEAMKIAPHRTGATAALLGAATFGAGSISASLASVLRNGTPIPMAGVIAASLAIGLAAMSLLIPRRPG